MGAPRHNPSFVGRSPPSSSTAGSVGVGVRGDLNLPDGPLVFPILGLLVGLRGGALLVVAAAPIWRVKFPRAFPSRRYRLPRCRWLVGIDSCQSLWPVKLGFAGFVSVEVTVVSLCSLVLRPSLRHDWCSLQCWREAGEPFWRLRSWICGFFGGDGFDRFFSRALVR